MVRVRSSNVSLVVLTAAPWAVTIVSCSHFVIYPSFHHFIVLRPLFVFRTSLRPFLSIVHRMNLCVSLLFVYVLCPFFPQYVPSHTLINDSCEHDRCSFLGRSKSTAELFSELAIHAYLMFYAHKILSWPHGCSLDNIERRTYI